MLLGFLSCKEAIENLNAYLDGELSPRDVRLVDKHLRLCRECTRKYKFEKELLDGIREKLERIQAPADLRERISRALADEQS